MTFVAKALTEAELGLIADMLDDPANVMHPSRPIVNAMYLHILWQDQPPGPGVPFARPHPRHSREPGTGPYAPDPPQGGATTGGP